MDGALSGTTSFSSERERRSGPHPVTSVVVFSVLTILVFHAATLLKVGILLGFIVGAAFVARLDWTRFRLLYLPFLFSLPVSFAVFIGSYWYGAEAAGDAVREGALQAALFNGRLGVLIPANILFIETTDWRQLSGALRRLHVPELVMVLLGAVLRFFPLMVRELSRIVEVQRSRGLKPSHLIYPKHFLPLVVPLLLLSMQRSQDLAISMELRGANGPEDAGPAASLSRSDALLAGLTIVLSATMLLL
ncbi:hypothetical protein GF324_11725 [bacterium]|nr:hypothetical protein [bacterium]